LQHQLTGSLAQANAQSWLLRSSSPKDLAHLRSIQGRDSGSWLEATPSSDKLALDPSEFRLVALMRLGSPMPFGNWLAECECGLTIDEHGYHLLSCKHGGGPVW
jgi:hypothetical protein